MSHLSCKSMQESTKFYRDVLGFVLIQHPSSLKFQGAWSFNYGLGIHLLESDHVPRKKDGVNPKDNHISFQSSNMKLVIQKLEEMRIEYVTTQVEDGGIKVDQLFFNDPDGYTIEICNGSNLSALPLSNASCPLKNPAKSVDTAIDTNYKLGSLENFFLSSEVCRLGQVETN